MPRAGLKPLRSRGTPHFQVKRLKSEFAMHTVGMENLNRTLTWWTTARAPELTPSSPFGEPPPWTVAVGSTMSTRIMATAKVYDMFSRAYR